MCVCVLNLVVVIVIIIARVHYYTLSRKKIFQRKKKAQERGSKRRTRAQWEKKKLRSNARHLIRILLAILRIRRIRGVDDRSGNVVVIRDA